MNTFGPDEIVDITIKGARVTNVDGADLEYQYHSQLGVVEGHVALDSPGVTVERVAPAEWPPRPGDLWRDVHGNTWFAHYNGAPSVKLVRCDGRHGTPDGINEGYGPLTLALREESEGGERP